MNEQNPVKYPGVGSHGLKQYTIYLKPIKSGHNYLLYLGINPSTCLGNLIRKREESVTLCSCVFGLFVGQNDQSGNIYLLVFIQRIIRFCDLGIRNPCKIAIHTIKNQANLVEIQGTFIIGSKISCGFGIPIVKPYGCLI